jgi:hypothetical protein
MVGTSAGGAVDAWIAFLLGLTVGCGLMLVTLLLAYGAFDRWKSRKPGKRVARDAATHPGDTGPHTVNASAR